MDQASSRSRRGEPQKYNPPTISSKYDPGTTTLKSMQRQLFKCEIKNSSRQVDQLDGQRKAVNVTSETIGSNIIYDGDMMTNPPTVSNRITGTLSGIKGIPMRNSGVKLTHMENRQTSYN